TGHYLNTETVGWAPIVSGFTGDIVFVGRGCPADAVKPGDPEDPYLANPAGKVAFIDRGGCAVSLKVNRAAKAGAIGVVLGSVSAEVGTGDGETAFGGTSGATPMVSGSAALLIQAYPKRAAMEIKTLLMNTAERDMQTDPALFPGVLAPITRIAGGEVRVDK